MGDLTPAVFRIRLRELFKLLYVPKTKGSSADSSIQHCPLTTGD